MLAGARRAAAAVRRASQSYLIALDRHPAPVKAVTASAIAAVGDCLCQAYQDGHSYDPSRTLGLSLYALLTTPLVHYWLTYISAASLTRGSAIKRMLADQLLWAPPATACFFYVFGGAALVRKAWLSTLLANWAVWPVIQLVVFSWVPAPLQVLSFNLVGVGWSIYTSSQAHAGEVKSHTP